MIIPNHKPLEKVYCLDHIWPSRTSGWRHSNSMCVRNETNADEKKKLFALIEDLELKKVKSRWESSKQWRGHCGWQQVSMWATNMCNIWVDSRRATTYQSDSNLRLLFESLAQLSYIELKVLQDALWYRGELHNWFVWGNVGVQTSNFSRWIVLGRILGRGRGNVFGKLYSLERWGWS